MIRRISAVLARAQRDERGMVLGNVLIFGTVMMLLVATMIAVSTSGAVKAASDRNFQNAMAAAYAGLADYQSKLSNDNGYALYGNANAQFSKSSGSTFVNADKNIAFTNSGSDWAPVVGSSDQWFRYEVDNSDYSGKGVLRVRVTGKAGASVRSLVANLKGDGFINYLYFTNYESSNPALTGTGCTTAYQWQSVAGKCTAVQFAGTDTLNGPIRTNDVFTSACSTVFNGSVEQHDTTVRPSSGTCAGTFNGGAATAVPYLGLPALNTNMSQETRTDLPTTVPRPGCMYTGPTRVKFLGNGKMTVWSPWSRATQIKVNSSSGAVLAADDAAKAAALCGAVSDLQSSAGATIPSLPSNLMYVQDIPSASNNVNAWGAAFPSKYTNTYCTTTVTVRSNGSATNTSNQPFNNGQGFPAAGEWINGGSSGSSYQTGSASDTYSCTAGDVFVSGAFSGAMTIAASGTVWVTDDITYLSATNDVLGLVGQNAVEISNPARCTSYPTTYQWGVGYVTDTSRCNSSGVGLLSRSPGESITVSAAIASNAGTFWNQNYDIGSKLGTLKVIGSIAQNWRGAVATTGNTGFSKNYVYDQRLLTTAPPKFLQPVSTSYGVTTQVEVQAAYTAGGSCATTTGGGCR